MTKLQKLIIGAVLLCYGVMLSVLFVRHRPATSPTQPHTYGAVGGYTLPAGAATGTTVYANNAGGWSTLAPGSNGQTYQLSSGIPSWATASGGATLPDAGTGGMWFQNDAGVVTPVAAATVVGQPLLSGPGEYPAFGTPTFGTGLVGTGNVTPPPTVAGGGWTSINNSTGLTASDQSNGSILIVFQNAASAGNGYVRTGWTTGVEIGFDMDDIFITTVAGGSAQQLWAGVCMWNGTQYLLMGILSYCTGATGYCGTGLILTGTDASGTQTQGNWSQWSKPFVRMQISGSNIISQLSVDKQLWSTIYTTAISTAFPSGTPTYGGVCVGHPPSNNGAVGLTLFDFVLN
jgi:hypothetical protein